MERYKRNILIEGFGTEGQEKLSKAKILVIGAGGLGSPVLLYLAAAGTGTLGIVDFDNVDESNLQRQIIHNTDDIGTPKALSAAAKIKALNPYADIRIHNGRFEENNADDLIRGYDFIIDCCDNYQTKFLINDACVRIGKPYSHGAIKGFQGEAMTYLPGHADYRKVFGSPPEEGNGNPLGVLGTAAGVIGSIQATEAIKYITGIGELLTDRLLLFDGVSMTFTTLKIKS